MNLIGRTSLKLSFSVGIFFFGILPNMANAYEAPAIRRCGGEIEAKTWEIWDAQGRAYANKLIQQRLLRDRDVYALYDLEINFHNLLAMAMLCGRTERLQTMAKDWIAVYGGLSANKNTNQASSPTQNEAYSDQNYQWICGGGRSCNNKNRLLGKEVRLVSLQGLGLFADLADALATSKIQDPSSLSFADRTLDVGLASLLRWGDSKSINRWIALSKARPDDVRDAGSTLLFTDAELWQIGVYASLAGVLDSAYGRKYSSQKEQTILPAHRDALRALLGVFKSRVFLEEIEASREGKTHRTKVADLDRGFWRLYKDNRYAGYSGKSPPAVCGKPQGSHQSRPSMNGSVPVVSDLGWDISHARRLIPVLKALDKNREAMKRVYGLSDNELPPKGVAGHFAEQIVEKVWNGDAQRPLFSNWLSGANGWYRVAYDNGMRRCVEGYGPWGLSISFATGGYAFWSSYNSEIGKIGMSIYKAMNSLESMDSDFYRQYYAPLVSEGHSAVDRQIHMLKFYPSLVMGVE